jgi:hypothetical protein
MSSIDEKMASKVKRGTVTNGARTVLDAQVEAFLKAGGKVQEIPNGVSAHTLNGGRRVQISLERKPLKSIPREGAGSPVKDEGL